MTNLLYAFNKSGLQIFDKEMPSTLEKIESIEMYRLLENGYRIQMIEVNNSSISVDTQYDLECAQDRFINE